jgi:ubiquinone/menaquinone biosynthesis C-methylase UbiE
MRVTETRERRPHAILDAQSRILKARKIIELVGRDRIAGARVLDIGTGAGVMASELSRLAREVVGVDVRDQRTVFDGFRFVRVEGTTLPFEDASFDVVLSNHVIEHVGERSEQLHHLREVSRVLTDGGVCYLAVPNKWVLLEPHFRLPFLSWLPSGLRDPYVRLARKGEFYDCNLPTRGSLERLFADAGFTYRELTIDAMRAMDRVESPSGLTGRILRAPDGVLRALMPVVPTMVYLLSKR